MVAGAEMKLEGDRRIAAGVLYSTIFHMMKRTPTKYVADGDINKLKKLAEQNALKYEEQLLPGEREYFVRLATKMGETMAEKERLRGQLRSEGDFPGDPAGYGEVPIQQIPTKDAEPTIPVDEGPRPSGRPGTTETRSGFRGDVPTGRPEGDVRHGDGVPGALHASGPVHTEGEARTGGAGPEDAPGEGQFDPDRALFVCLRELRRLAEVQSAAVSAAISRINASSA